MPSFERFLVPTDYSDCSREALRTAVGLAAVLGARVDVVHVWSAPYFGPGYGSESGALLDPAAHKSLFDLIRDGATEQMRTFVASVTTLPGVTVTTHVESGEPSRRVLEIAEQSRPDLIVAGTHGRSGPRRWLLGSVAERLVRHAPCPVLTVPPPGPGG